MGRNKRKFSSIGDIVGNVRRLVLIVDDEEINRLILGNIMGPQYQIAYAVDGVEALKFVQENYRNLSAVLLDLNMPNMDGRTLLNQTVRHAGSSPGQGSQRNQNGGRQRVY